MNDSIAPKRLRSPPYPTLSLQRAIERAELLYRQERDHPVPLTAAARAWGMSPTSSSPVVTVAALKQYGLVAEDGGGEIRKVRLTADGLRLLLDKDPNSIARRETLRRAFLTPKMFQELWNRWNSKLPSDATVLSYLMLERRLANQAAFSEQAATELLANYRVSLPFAAPGEGTNVPSDAKQSEEAAMELSLGDSARDARDDISRTLASSQDAVSLAADERLIFAAEGEPTQRLKLIWSGAMDEFLIDTLLDYLNRQKNRIKAAEQN